jgi:hypothetical protein
MRRAVAAGRGPSLHTLVCWDLMNDRERLGLEFEEQANFCDWRCQYHNCGTTCVKYSYRQAGVQPERQGRKKVDPCRFKMPHKCYARTEITEDGIVHIKRSHPRINRWNKAMAVGLRHNFDLAFLNTRSQGLSMMYYITNYATKLNTPTWKRLFLGASALESLRGEEHGHGGGAATDGAVTNDREQVRNNRTRQFFNRWANRIFSDRELSSVEVCYHLLGFQTDFTDNTNWEFVNLNTLYWAAFRRWPGVQRLAGDELHQESTPESVVFTDSGPKLSYYAAYPHRGDALADLSFWEYLSFVSLRRRGTEISARETQVSFSVDSELGERWVQVLRRPEGLATPVITGYLGTDLEEEIEHYFQR